MRGQEKQEGEGTRKVGGGEFMVLFMVTQSSSVRRLPVHARWLENNIP